MTASILANRMRLMLSLLLCALALSGQQRLCVKRVVGLEYPWLAKLARAQGKVELLALVSADGAVGEVRVVSGHDLLSYPARLNLSRWLFSGCAKTNAPCKVKVDFSFVLEGDCDDSHCGTEFSADLPSSVLVKSKKVGPIID